MVKLIKEKMYLLYLVFGWSISTMLRNCNVLYLNCLQLNLFHFLN